MSKSTGRHHIFFSFILLLFGALPGCLPASSSDYDVLRAQVAQHNQILSQLNTQLSGVQPAQADTWQQVQAMRQEIASLRGDVENLSHGFNQAGGASAMAEMLARHDRALRLIETQLAMPLQLDEAAAFSGPTYTPSYAPSPMETSPVVTRVPSATPQTTPSSTVTSPARPGAVDTAQALYDAGMASFAARKYEQGLKSFADFAEAYPNHSLVSNAWFWQGECHFELKNYAAAALAYEKVISGYPNSNKAPDSYFKQGLSFVRLDRKEAARERLNQLISQYPRSVYATRAKQELDKL